MSNQSDTIRSLLHRFGVVGPARVRVLGGTGARIAVLLTVAVAIAAFSAAPALAKEVHVYSSFFGEPCNATPCGNGQFKEPAGVAVNDSTSLTEPTAGDVYVVDKGNNRVEYFSATGEYKGQFNGAAAPTGAFSKPEWIAVDNDESSPSFGDVYVTDNGHKAIDKFSATGTYLGQLTGACEVGKSPPCTLIPFTELDGVAVDLAGALWVYQSSGAVDNYSDALANEFLGSRELQLYGVPAVDHASPNPGFAVGPEAGGSEDVLYASYSFAETHSFLPFNSVGEYAGRREYSVPMVWEYGGNTASAVDLSNGELYIDYGTTVGAFNFSAGSAGTQIETSFGSGHLSASTGVAVNSSTGSALSNSVYVSDATADRVDVFPEVTLADTTTEAATGVSETAATLHGTVNPVGIAVSACEFEYRTEAEPEYGQHSIACSHLPGSGTANVAVEATPSTLTPNTTYRYRVSATNIDGTDYGSEAYFNGPEASFTTSSAPRISSVSAEVNQTKQAGLTTATLKATIDPDGRETTYQFEYGETESFGTSVPPAPASIGSGYSPVAVTAELSGLKAGARYYYRVVASNEYGPAANGGHRFTTLPPTLVEAESVSGVTATTATLSGEVNPGGIPPSECKFEYGTSTVFYNESAPCEAPDAAEIGSGTALVKVHADLKGLLGGTAYRFRLVATNDILGTNETFPTAGDNEEFTTSTVPVIASGEAVDVTAGGAELRANVNPEGLQVTHCAFEYGTSTSYGSSVRCAQKKSAIGYGTEPVPVSAQLSELAPNTTYYWRLSVRDANGEGYEPGHTFVYPTTGAELPDHRSYEMVSPPFKNGGLIGDVFLGFLPRISEAGSRVIAPDIQCFAPSQSCTGSRGNEGEPFEFTRMPTGWVTTALQPPAAQFSENSSWLVDADEGTALFSMPTGPSGEDEFYARSSEGVFSAIGPVTPGSTGVGPFHTSIKVATAGFSHLVWNEEGGSIHEYVGAGNTQPFLVGVTGPRGSEDVISSCETWLGGGHDEEHSPQTWNDLSADGRTVYFNAVGHDKFDNLCPSSQTAPPVNELFARVDGEESGAHTVAISEPMAPETLASTPVDGNCTSEECLKDIGEPADWSAGLFEGASADGSKVLFTSTQQLTNEAVQGTGSTTANGCSSGAADCNLYLYDFARPAGHNLIDLSAPEGSGETPRVQGVTAISADGSHVYFVARGVLSAQERPGCKASFEAAKLAAEGRCQARDGAENLYVYAAGHTTFVAPLGASDAFNDWEQGAGGYGESANVTPDGRFLVFASYARLTPDDTGGGASTQIFRYDADTGQLLRVSIGNDGFHDDGNAGDGQATIVPAFWGAFGGVRPARGDPTMSNDGSYVFFQSPRALTPHALDDVVIGHFQGKTEYAQNVYEYHEGHVYLVSDGRDASGTNTPCGARSNGSTVCLLGADGTGSNVFFMTADQLVPKDTDTQVDIYDARICEPAGGNPCISEPPPPLPPCGGEACHGIPPERSPLLTGGSETLNGKGNIAPVVSPPPKKVTKKAAKCKKGFLKNKKGKCVKKPKKSKKAKKSTRRAK